MERLIHRFTLDYVRFYVIPRCEKKVNDLWLLVCCPNISLVIMFPRHLFSRQVWFFLLYGPCTSQSRVLNLNLELRGLRVASHFFICMIHLYVISDIQINVDNNGKQLFCRDTIAKMWEEVQKWNSRWSVILHGRTCSEKSFRLSAIFPCVRLFWLIQSLKREQIGQWECTM